ncbi:MAG: acyl-[acyl-carrier-protein]--UDP-N-acetylglucosamine O-acyltransferase [Candidatus Omnitrophica bacterium CG11_big_fil_rev_8_21_14_0_20_64_10]|nr:MAG: acyl-[acyl-carrier-protein]--UDP-N-acetylglucosamine O-acyltransferase [Candidatus Omnitrophica bacterium CG11_big_fil_rev_8_21_14_0_20_64_10]
MSTAAIHPTAVVDPRAQIAADAQIGPYAVIEGPVRIGAGCVIGPHAVLTAPLEIGAGCQIHVGAVLGHPHQAVREPQAGGVRIGPRTVIREYATVHRSSQAGTWTEIGPDCLIMGLAHVAHDCRVGRGVILSNGALLAGHITIEDRAIISGNAAVHQFVRIGTLAMVAGLSRVNKDVPPYFLVKGDSEIWSINVVGLKRAGFSEAARTQIRQAYRLLYRSDLNTAQGLKAVEKLTPILPETQHLIEFIKGSDRGICPARRLSKAVTDTVFDREGEQVDGEEEDVV